LPPALALRGTAAADAPLTRPAGGLPPGARAQSSAATIASTSPSPRGRHDRMAERMNDVVVRRIFAAGLDLQAALGLIGEHPTASERRAAGKICHASDELDRAIRDLRDILFEGGPE